MVAAAATAATSSTCFSSGCNCGYCSTIPSALESELAAAAATFVVVVESPDRQAGWAAPESWSWCMKFHGQNRKRGISTLFTATNSLFFFAADAHHETVAFYAIMFQDVMCAVRNNNTNAREFVRIDWRATSCMLKIDQDIGKRGEIDR